MRAIVLHEFGSLDSLVIEEMPEPEAKPGTVVIQVKAFGINHAEMHMRKVEWAEAAKVSGIECVGLVKACPDGQIAVGAKVAALMGGLGRTINGSYAEYTRAPLTNVVPIKTDLPWAELAVIPESYATAWTCLHGNLEIAEGDLVVIRGATSALGRAALNIAANAGARVIATTRKRERFPDLEALGAWRVEIESPTSRSASQSGRGSIRSSIWSATAPLLDSLAMVRRRGRVCLAGFLGGLDPVSISIHCSRCRAAHFSFFGSFVFGTPDFPCQRCRSKPSSMPPPPAVTKLKPARVFRFEDIREAHRVMESNQANGKMVVVV